MHVRSASLVDSQLVREWRNHERSRRYSKNTAIISKDEHDNWYGSRIKSIDEQPFWIFSDKDNQLGMVRFDQVPNSKGVFEISICVNPIFHNLGYGKIILTEAISMHFKIYPVSKIIATINSNNTHSLSLFTKCGFSKAQKLGGFIVLDLINRNLRVIFRADASYQIGTGHTQRPLGLIQEFITLGYKVIFVGETSEIIWVSNQINSLGFSETVSKEADFSPDPQTDILILDSYHIPINADFISKKHWLKIVVIQDGSTPAYPADLLIRYDLLANSNELYQTKILSGPKFILLRKTVMRLPKKSKESGLNITVVGGGVDKIGFAKEMSKQLARIAGNFKVNFFTENVIDIHQDSRFKTFNFGEQLDKIGNESDLVFCTASSISLEFIARGCPVGIVCGWPNQKEYYESLSSLKVALDIGVFCDNKWSLSSRLIRNLITSKTLRNQLSDKAKELIDLDGNKRVLSEIMLFKN